ncbi:hypothetical protein OVA24_14600 [Luteolibacter sp. SL250]|uniref:hypothetical protein n=1 Tax=Luteolibacter sp. SL250 TaxID=2995170 RepID=UPI00226F86E8|nr:hypothetical protein [Luteolibacter sp. SL250]WAC18462.1 hypothetical protein OVA24_14600 [Luteolibacter sp. SL250]
MVKVLAYLSLGALVVGAFYYFDRDMPSDEAWIDNERHRMDLQNQIEVAGMRLERREREGTNGKFGEATANLEALTAHFDKRMADFEALSGQVAEMEEKFIAFREKQLGELRSRAVGREWPEFVSAAGRVLKDATVITVDDTGVMMRHRDGSARMRYEDLTEEQRCFFGLEEESAISALKEEHQRAHDYEQWVRNAEEDAKIREIVAREEAAMSKYSSGLRKPLPRAKRFRAVLPPPVVTSNDSPLRIKSLSDPPQKVNQNPRFRVRGTPRYTYYYNSTPASYGAGSYGVARGDAPPPIKP